MKKNQYKAFTLWGPRGMALCAAACLAVTSPKANAATVKAPLSMPPDWADEATDAGFSDGLGGLAENREPEMRPGKDANSEDMQTMAKKKAKKKKKKKKTVTHAS